MGGLRKLRRSGAGQYTVEPLRGNPDRQSGELSAVILDFARPLTENVDDDHFEKAINLAILCWNVALLPESRHEQELRFIADTMAKDAPAGFADETMTWTRWLVERKKKLFPHDRRMVVSHTDEDRGNSHHLLIASTLVPLSSVR